MNFDELDSKMRVFETSHDHYVLPGLHMVVRIDGRGFTRLTKETHTFETPFDVRVRDYMVATVEHLMTCGFRILYGYTQSDEISLLVHPQEQAFGRKLRKYISILASEAGACFSLQLGGLASFDARVSQLPRGEDVIDYFRWRQEDAHRNALSAHCYWLLRRQGQSVTAATAALTGVSIAQKNELLFQSGINFNELPSWQKRGVGFYWEAVDHIGFNPVKNESAVTIRQKLTQNFELPIREGYSAFIQRLLAQGTNTSIPE